MPLRFRQLKKIHVAESGGMVAQYAGLEVRIRPLLSLWGLC